MEMSTPTEELTKHVERVTTTSTPRSPLFMLFNALRAMGVINPAEFFIRESFVGLGDFDEFFGGGFIVGVFVRVVFFGQAAVGLFEVAFGRGFVDAEEGVVVFGGEGEEGEEADECQDGEEEHGGGEGVVE